MYGSLIINTYLVFGEKLKSMVLKEQYVSVIGTYFRVDYIELQLYYTTSTTETLYNDVRVGIGVKRFP